MNARHTSKDYGFAFPSNIKMSLTCAAFLKNSFQGKSINFKCAIILAGEGSNRSFDCIDWPCFRVIVLMV